MSWTLEQFAAACQRALTDNPGPGSRKKVSAIVQDVLKDEAFVAKHVGDDVPERKILYEDPKLGFCILAHVYQGAKESNPHDHGPSWAIYGQARGETVMSDWALVEAAAPNKPGKVRHVTSYTLKPGMAHVYNEGDLHSPRREGATRLIRIEGTNMDKVRRLAYEQVSTGGNPMAQASTLSYGVVEGWEQLPAGYAHRDVAGVAVDAEDRVFLICRGNHPIIIYDRKGNFLGSWGQGDFTLRTHGITVGPDGLLYCSDDGNHTVRKFTPEGKLLMTLGTMNTPSDTGYDGKNTATVSRAGGPFNRPTNLAVGPRGELYVSDGYGNCRVHLFSPTGELKRSWGVPGQGPGEFFLPHGIAVAADGRVFVCDRENDRIQIFSPDGEYLAEWTDTRRPTHLVFDGQGRAYVSELWWQPGQTSRRYGPAGEIRSGRVSVYDRDGRVLARWGGPDPVAAGSFAAPHGIGVDSRGDVYVSEVTWTFAGSRGHVPESCHTFQKFALRS